MRISSNQMPAESCPNCNSPLQRIPNPTHPNRPAKVIIFGAGASAGSTKVNAPPIGENLFGELANFDPVGWGSIPDSQKTVFQGDFESGMMRLAQFDNNKLPPLQKSMAAFFFQYAPDTQNLYRKFCERLKNTEQSIGLASLNYERLLELAIADTGQDLEICLPHGCCNIFCDGATTDTLGAEFPGTGVTTTGLIYSINDRSQFNYKLAHDSFPPVMSYFEPYKRVTSGVNFIDEQKQKWSALCEAAKEIYVIGIKPRPGDSHIWGTLGSTHSKLIYCSGSNGALQFKEWSQSLNRTSEDLILDGRFEEEFEKICDLIGI
ncbi:hypothetical protein [Polynucleobacter sp. UB-Tiil-W10]|uniref:hypothetical protein n=1 Tax=Polynucleobacter sp. UB-Tiil-W10 TaxID=1855648 RepID=UPI001C0BE9E0|nr:hypothetical protein [Polynucleobacter sp. UB-Tiil-W10]MBU3541367.1 hypothetical protein [Polynucleobacter sp. UB-Tiil-W10]